MFKKRTRFAVYFGVAMALVIAAGSSFVDGARADAPMTASVRTPSQDPETVVDAIMTDLARGA